MYSRAFQALWIGEMISAFGGAAGGILNGLVLYEVTGSREWMGALWLVYFIPSLLLQGFSAPFLNVVRKEVILRRSQLIRSSAYLLPLSGYLINTEWVVIASLIALQCLLGLIQPIYASLSFALLPDLCEDQDLVDANGLLDGTLRLMSFLAPGVTSLLLLFASIPIIYGVSSLLFLMSYFSLRHLPKVAMAKDPPVWSKQFWWDELKSGYHTFFRFPQLMKLTFLSSTVQFAVGASMVLSVPFIRKELQGDYWDYAIFAGAFPLGYVLGMILLTKLPKSNVMMYFGLIGGGFSFILLFFVNSIPLAWCCELFGGLLFPFFNAQSSAVFQREAPRERLSQLSAVRLLFLRLTMPIGILFASISSMFQASELYGLVGMMIVIFGFLFLILSFSTTGIKGHSSHSINQ
ncbi:MFS transporter [Bacillus sp. RAR_GA_16]|uniref:MFS transporter n=1 Tax=Bacillus sp. RAR_GA_16 TaxID=2876774 RepID=UPI001CCD1815|nr:MFS transporter [Bacillus sp. RAR_GA_16]